MVDHNRLKECHSIASHKDEHSMNLLLKNMAIMLSLIAGSHTMEPRNLFEMIPEDNQKIMILAEAALPYYYKDGHPGELASVCKKWYQLINFSILPHPIYKTLITMEDYCHFNLYINGRVIYKPNTDYKNNMKIMRIADLMNSSGEFNSFDLKECGGVGKYIKITPGYKKQLSLSEKFKFEIWIVLRSEIEKDLKEGKAAHFKEIFKKWNTKAPIGIFWTTTCKKRTDIAEDLENYNYNITKNLTFLSYKSLYEIGCSKSGDSINNLGACYGYESTQLITPRVCLQSLYLCFDPELQVRDNPTQPPIVPMDDQPWEFQIPDLQVSIPNLANPCTIS